MQKIKCRTPEEAIQYVKDHKLVYEKAERIKTWGSDEVNIVWWKDLRYEFSDEGAKKVAHFNSKQQVLVIY